MPHTPAIATHPGPQLLGICGSLKPASGQSTPSACREMLGAALTLVGRAFPYIETLDLRDARVPAFEGIVPDEHPDQVVMECHRKVAQAAGLALSVPAYWGGLGGAFKSFVETICGPPYSTRSLSPFCGRPVVVLIVGSDPASAAAAADQVPPLLEAVGAQLTAPLVVLADPANEAERRAAAAGFVGAIAALARDCLLAEGR